MATGDPVLSAQPVAAALRVPELLKPYQLSCHVLPRTATGQSVFHDHLRHRVPPAAQHRGNV